MELRGSAAFLSPPVSLLIYGCNDSLERRLPTGAVYAGADNGSAVTTSILGFEAARLIAVLTFK